MERAVYGIFQDRRTAQDAMNALVAEGVPQEVIDVQLHSGELDVEDLPGPATASRQYVKYGVPVIAVIGATVGAITGGWPGALLGILFAVVLGTIAAALSGRIDPGREAEGLERQVEGGRSVVIVDVAGSQVGVDFEQFLRRRGALRVGMT